MIMANDGVIVGNSQNISVKPAKRHLSIVGLLVAPDKGRKRRK